jgi:hypothetical protein
MLCGKKSKNVEKVNISDVKHHPFKEEELWKVGLVKELIDTTFWKART